MRLAWLLTNFISLATANGARWKNNEVWKDDIFKMPDLKNICENYRNASDVNTTCIEKLDLICHNMTLFLAMRSATPSFPFTGLGYASNLDFGNYEQCLKIDHHYNGTRLLGEYCRLNMFIPQSFNYSYNDSTFYRLSTCRPYGCSDDDYNTIIDEGPDFPIAFSDSRCETAKNYQRNFTKTDFVTIIQVPKIIYPCSTYRSIFGSVIFMMAISTMYDIYIYKKRLKSVHPLLTMFSAFSNGRQLLHIADYSKSKEHIEVFQGFRSIGMLWIVAGHAMMVWEKVPLSNMRREEEWSLHLSSWYILTAPLSVDTFFYMSGFLLAFHYLKYKEKSLRQHVVSVPYLYIHRYLRLTPPLVMVYLVFTSVFRYLGNGPDWYTMSDERIHDCIAYRWPFFLHYQNYKNYEHVCLPQTWYVSTDFQLFLLAPLVLIPLSQTLKKPNGLSKCMILLALFNVFCTLMPLYINLRYRKYDNWYGTHSKLIDFYSGVMLAVYMREKIDKPFLYIIKEHRRAAVNLIIWILILLGMLSVTICYQDQEVKDKYVSLSTFYALMRPSWCLGLSWITYSCYHGKGGLVSWILCRPIFQIMGRLTYCIYLVHQMVIDYHHFSRQSSWYFSDYNAFYFFCGHYVISFGLAIFWTLAFESPFIVLAKYWFGSRFKREPTVLNCQQVIQPTDSFQNISNYKLTEKCPNVEGVYKINNDMT